MLVKGVDGLWCGALSCFASHRVKVAPVPFTVSCLLLRYELKTKRRTHSTTAISHNGRQSNDHQPNGYRPQLFAVRSKRNTRQTPRRLVRVSATTVVSQSNGHQLYNSCPYQRKSARERLSMQQSSPQRLYTSQRLRILADQQAKK